MDAPHAFSRLMHVMVVTALAGIAMPLGARSRRTTLKIALANVLVWTLFAGGGTTAQAVCIGTSVIE